MRAPEMEAALAMVVVPVAAPIFKAVAAPAKLTVVAVVLTRAKVVEGVVRLVVMAGEGPKTARPDPVSSDIELIKTDDAAEVVKLLAVSVNSIREAVKSARLMTPVPESRIIFPVVDPPKVKVCMAVEVMVGVPYKLKAPEILAVPLTSNLANGVVVPMPTCPEASTNKEEVRTASPPTERWILRVPAFKILKV